MSPRALSLHLLPILLLLLLELPEVGLDGAGCFLHFNGAERRNWRGARPVAGVGVWAGQKTGDSRRGRGNSRAGKVCSNDWFSNTRCTLKPPFKLAFFLFLLFWSISGFDFTLDVAQTLSEKSSAVTWVSILTLSVHPYAVPPEAIKLQREHNSPASNKPTDATTGMWIIQLQFYLKSIACLWRHRSHTDDQTSL